MAQHTEPLNQGLVTARDASLLEQGELQRADDLMYRPASQSLHRVPGRIQFSSAGLTDLKGVAYCGFDGTDDQVVVLASETLYAADAGENGTFASIGTAVGGVTLDSVHYNNHHVLLTGGTQNRVLIPAGTLRSHGLLAVTNAPRITVTAGGNWPLVDDEMPTYYDYWTTEVYRDDTNNEFIEGTFEGVPAIAFIPDLTTTVEINRPDPVNVDPSSTHWRVYRSIAHAAGVTAFPVGYRIAELPMSTTAFLDGAGTTTAALPIGTTADSRRIPVDPQFPNVTYIAWTSRTNVIASDAAYATGTSNYDFFPTTTRIAVEMEVSNFTGVTAIGNPVTDITITLKGYHSRSDGHLAVSLSWDAGVNWTGYQYAYLGVNSGAPVTYTLSGLWGRTWTSSELQAATFVVSIAGTNTSQGSVTHNLDYATLTVTHGGTTADQTQLFPGFPVTVGGQTLLIGSNGAPPVANTGDIFQESLVTNDIAHPTRVAYSLPGNIDAFPSAYILNLETKDKDRLTCIRSLGSVCLFGLAGQLQRANYLPRSDDAEFDRGRCVEVVDNDNGIPGPFAACKFVLAGRLMCFYASRSGPRMTDGYESTTANDDLAWDTTVDLDNLTNCVAINNARYQEILLFYDPDGAGLTHCLRFQYHPTHLKNGKLKATGPCDISIVGAAVGVNELGERLLYSAHPNGLVYLENRGDSDASGHGITPGLTTRDMYIGGLGGEWELHRVLVHTQGATATTVSLRYTSTRSNLPERTTAPRDFIAQRRGFNLVSPGEAGEGISVLLDATDNEEPLTFDYLVVEGRVVSQTTPLTR